MGRRGPQPAHPALQAARRTRPSRMRGTVEAVPAIAGGKQLLPVKPPDHLEGPAAECWTRIATTQIELARAGAAPVISESERELFEVACDDYGRWRLAKEIFDTRLRKLRAAIKREKADDGQIAQAMLGENSKGDLVVNSYQLLMERTAKAVRQSFRALGLPSTLPQVIAQIETETASGDKVAARLLV